MNIVITMAGLGTRFKEAGYPMPKYQIEARGRTLFEWSLESLAGFYEPSNRYIFVVRKADEAAGFIRAVCEKLGYQDIRIVEILEATDGQATTALLAGAFWNKEEELLIYNIDTYVEPAAMKRAGIRGDGFIPCFLGTGDHWSFVRLDQEGRAVEVREKERISDYCTLGAYYFKSCGLYESLYREYYVEQGNQEKGERYIAPLYNHLIRSGGEVRIMVVNQELVHVLGTPKELAVFLEEH